MIDQASFDAALSALGGVATTIILTEKQHEDAIAAGIDFRGLEVISGLNRPKANPNRAQRRKRVALQKGT